MQLTAVERKLFQGSLHYFNEKKHNQTNSNFFLIDYFQFFWGKKKKGLCEQYT